MTVVASGVDHGNERELTKVPASIPPLHHRQFPSRSGATKDFFLFGQAVTSHFPRWTILIEILRLVLACPKNVS